MKNKTIANLVMFGGLFLILISVGINARDAIAGAIKVWNPGETLTSNDLNANFAHIHNTMVGGHGARLINSDVSPTANISFSKLENAALIPKAWAQIYSGTPCVGATSAVCAVIEQVNVISVVGAGTTGVYNVTLAYTPADADMAPLVTPHTTSVFCWVENTMSTPPHIQVRCRNDAGAATDSNFQILVMDI